MTTKFKGFFKRYRLALDIGLSIISVLLWLLFVFRKTLLTNKMVSATNSEDADYFARVLEKNSLYTFLFFLIAVLIVGRSLIKYWQDIKDKRRSNKRTMFQDLEKVEQQMLLRPLFCKDCQKRGQLEFQEEIYALGEYYLELKCLECANTQKLKRQTVDGK